MNSQLYLTSIELENQALDAYCASPPFETLNPTNMSRIPRQVQEEILSRREKDLASQQAQSASSQAIGLIIGGAILFGIVVFSVIDSFI